MEHATTGHVKQYVFVDEYNRHKRLKVMRACDGCRKRKIKCDGALQNGPWPCGACVRLELKCLPPTPDGDEEQQGSPLTSTTGQGSFSTENATFNTTKNQQNSGASYMAHQWATSVQTSLATERQSSPPRQQGPDASCYTSYVSKQPLGSGSESAYSDSGNFGSSTGPSMFSHSGAVPSLLRSQTEVSSSSGGDPEELDAAVVELSQAMGDLKVDVTAMAPYIANQKQNLTEEPTVEEADVLLPSSVTTDSRVRIPPEMMPSDERAMDYFGYFFGYIHPYVPVLDRETFYGQWRNARHTISPLILEGLFACVSRYLEQPMESKRWLALASRHEESYRDVPRLSTIQAMILLLKARESVPKRGYFYRSWMAVKYCASMSIDLGLNEHYLQHEGTNHCTLDRADCTTRTRIWQILFAFEVFIGGPQGRSDFIVELETVNVEIPSPGENLHVFEYQISRRYALLSQAVKNIKITNSLWRSMRRKKKDWALDPAFSQHDDDLVSWMRRLPPDLQIHYPDDGSPPWLGGDHFAANLHAYYHLVVIMHHRPQLQAKLEKRDPSFKTNLDICLQSATLMCRVQEALIRDFGLHGLLFMLRGINFTVYCVLTCTMLFLAAITSPDPVQNSQARIYFTRHMRVLEHCICLTSVEVQDQITALREAFSQDTSKPFELKPTLGLHSPTLAHHPTPAPLQAQRSQTSVPLVSNSKAWAHLQTADSSKVLSPTSEYDQAFDPENGQSSVTNSIKTSHSPLQYQPSYDLPSDTTYASHSMQSVPAALQQQYSQETAITPEQNTPIWDPSGIFNQWSTAFGSQAQPATHPSPPDLRFLQPTSAPMMLQPQQRPPDDQGSVFDACQMLTNPAVQVPQAIAPVPTVTPVMWQDAFTSAYVSGHGQKRFREESLEPAPYSQYTSMKRRG